MNMIDAALIIDSSRANRVKLYTVVKREYYNSYTKAHKILKSIGNVYKYYAKSYIPHGNIYSGWRSKKNKSGGGVLMDMGYHLLDVIVRYFGEPKDIVFKGSNTGKRGYIYSVEDSASLLMSHNNGIHGCFQLGCLSGPKEEKLEIRGDQGTLNIEKDKISIFNNDNTETIGCSSSGAKAVSLALNFFIHSSYEECDNKMDHHLNLMKVIDQAYLSKEIA